MRCYRCGALMDDSAITCPECGFFLNSPVEIQMRKGMKGVDIFDKTGNVIWSGTDTETAYIDAPEKTKVIICYRINTKEERNVINGEAYRFIPTRLAEGFVKLIKTRTRPKRKKRCRKNERKE